MVRGYEIRGCGIMWFARIKRFYDAGLWTKEMVADAVVFGRITPEQYEQITGEPYVPA